MSENTASVTSGETSVQSRAYARYSSATSRWGRLTMIVCLILSLSGPLYLVFGTDLQLQWSQLLTAFVAVAAVFGVLWVVEVVTYYPVLGPAATYQAFMIGNIANKLLPAAIVAQSSIGAQPGTRRAELSAVMAICGAALVHVTSLLIFVGFLGTWLISIMPAPVIDVAQLYIFPAIIGAVIVQLAVYVRSVRILLIALGVAAVVELVVAPQLGDMFGNFSTAIVVLLTVVLAWVLRDRSAHAPADTGPTDQES